MAKESKPTTVLDLSKGLVFGLLYKPVIGQTSRSEYPLIVRFRRGYRPSK